jgi:hypothetical protein
MLRHTIPLKVSLKLNLGKIIRPRILYSKEKLFRIMFEKQV